MIKPYTAVGLIPTVRGIRKREDITINLECWRSCPSSRRGSSTWATW